MSITFQCAACKREVEASDETAGKRGKCPFCGASNDMPAAMPTGDDEIPLAPLDEEEEKRRQAEIRRLFRQESALLSESNDKRPAPLEHRENISADDVEHFVVNYCLDMLNSRLDSARLHVQNLRKYKAHGTQAVDDFLSGKRLEPALDTIPTRLLQNFLRQLRDEIA